MTAPRKPHHVLSDAEAYKKLNVRKRQRMRRIVGYSLLSLIIAAFAGFTVAFGFSAIDELPYEVTVCVGIVSALFTCPFIAYFFLEEDFSGDARDPLKPIPLEGEEAAKLLSIAVECPEVREWLVEAVAHSATLRLRDYDEAMRQSDEAQRRYLDEARRQIQVAACEKFREAVMSMDIPKASP